MMADVQILMSPPVQFRMSFDSALRTHAGDAHGREKGFARIDPRIARLAIHAASTVALFLIETWERKFKRALPQAAPLRATAAERR
jgi:hypothetical protein